MSRVEPQDYRKATQEELLVLAQNVVDKEIRQCTLFKSDRLNALPLFDKSELILGRVIGRGSFAVCHEITAVKLKQLSSFTASTTASRPTSELSEDSEVESSIAKKNARSKSESSLKPCHDTERDRLAHRIGTKKGVRYVTKRVNHDAWHADKSTYLKGTIDLALETQFLASLDHNHILAIRGLARSTPYELNGGYFLILDQLKETFSKRLCAWMHRYRATKGVTGLLTNGKRKVAKLYLERLLAALNVADAMDYLHRKHIIFRDIKPDNIGFTVDGTLKCFDFGLARQLRVTDRVDNDRYMLTPFTGSIRYMAPEVGLRQPYNLKADVYAWAMLLHYIIALEPPMGAYTPNMFVERVFKLGHRPAVKDKWSRTIRDLMRQSWSEDVDERPEFAEIIRLLKQEIVSVDSQALGSFTAEPIDEKPFFEAAPITYNGEKAT